MKRTLRAKPKPDYMSVKAVCERFGVSDSHVRNLIRRGRLEAIWVGKRVLVRRESVEALERRPPPPPI